MQRKINFNAKENVVHLNYLNVQLESANEQCHEVNKRAKKKESLWIYWIFFCFKSWLKSKLNNILINDNDFKLAPLVVCLCNVNMKKIKNCISWFRRKISHTKWVKDETDRRKKNITKSNKCYSQISVALNSGTCARLESHHVVYYSNWLDLHRDPCKWSIKNETGGQTLFTCKITPTHKIGGMLFISPLFSSFLCVI